MPVDQVGHEELVGAGGPAGIARAQEMSPRSDLDDILI